MHFQSLMAHTVNPELAAVWLRYMLCQVAVDMILGTAILCWSAVVNCEDLEIASSITQQLDATHGYGMHGTRLARAAIGRLDGQGNPQHLGQLRRSNTRSLHE